MKVVTILSGGLDSTTLLHCLHNEGYLQHALSFNYGQRHVKELQYAKASADALGIAHTVVDMQFMADLLSNSALTSDIDVPEGNYQDSSMKTTVVPNRNMIMASIAIGVAVNLDYDAVALGVHSGDHDIYPDCRPEFVEALSDVARVANYKAIEVLAPFVDVDKIGILAQGLKLGVDYSKTWTCYKGNDLACGKCGSCTERLEAFAMLNRTDPLRYED